MGVRLEIDDPEPLVDQPAGLRVTGLEPSQRVAMHAAWTLAGIPMRSTAEYVADGLGVVDPATNPSLGGTYVGLDPFGLWWSARPRKGEPPRPAGLDDVPTTIAVRGAGAELASGHVNRRWAAAGVEAVEVRDDGLVGLLCLPAGAGPFPGVVVVGGSMGGLAGADTRAALLASRGIAALAVAYFGVEGRPPGLVEIPLEYLRQACIWLRAHRRVVPGRVGVFGSSRGAELALLLGAFPEVGCVVAASPSCVVWSGVPLGQTGINPLSLPAGGIASLAGIAAMTIKLK